MKKFRTLFYLLIAVALFISTNTSAKENAATTISSDLLIKSISDQVELAKRTESEGKNASIWLSKDNTVAIEITEDKNTVVKSNLFVFFPSNQNEIFTRNSSIFTHYLKIIAPGWKMPDDWPRSNLKNMSRFNQDKKIIHNGNIISISHIKSLGALLVSVQKDNPTVKKLPKIRNNLDLAVHCEKFDILSNFKDKTTTFTLSTDLPEHTTILASVSRSYWNGNNEKKSFEYYNKKISVRDLRKFVTVVIEDEKFRLRMAQMQQLAPSSGTGKMTLQVSENIEINLMVAINQTNNTFGKNNKNLTGPLVEAVNGYKMVRAKKEYASPVKTSNYGSPQPKSGN